MKQYPHLLYIDQIVNYGLDSNGNWQPNGAVFAPQVGDLYGGGIIFYVDTTGKHGLICGLTDLSTGVHWYNGTFINTGASSHAVGGGNDNTDKIIKYQGIGTYAASLCRLYNGGGFTDWQLPSADDFMQIKHALIDNSLGSFANLETYWTSTEFETSPETQVHCAQIGSIDDDFIATYPKDSSFYVRPIRSF